MNIDIDVWSVLNENNDATAKVKRFFIYTK